MNDMLWIIETYISALNAFVNVTTNWQMGEFCAQFEDTHGCKKCSNNQPRRTPTAIPGSPRWGLQTFDAWGTRAPGDAALNTNLMSSPSAFRTARSRRAIAPFTALPQMEAQSKWGACLNRHEVGCRSYTFNQEVKEPRRMSLHLNEVGI